MNSVNSEIRQEKRSIGLDSVKVKGHTHWCVYCLAPRIEPRGELTCASFGFPNHTTMRGSTPSLLTFTRSYMTAKSRRFLALAVVFVLSWGFFVLAAGEAHAEQLPEAQQPKTQVKQPKTLVNNGKSPKNEGDNMTVVGRKPPHLTRTQADAKPLRRASPLRRLVHRGLNHSRHWSTGRKPSP